MVAGGTDPAARAENGGPDRKSGDQRGYRKAIEDGHLSEQGVIVDERSDPQCGEAGEYPDALLPPRLGEVSVPRGAVDLEHSERTDRRHQNQHQPVEVAERSMSRHISVMSREKIESTAAGCRSLRGARTLRAVPTPLRESRN